MKEGFRYHQNFAPDTGGGLGFSHKLSEVQTPIQLPVNGSQLESDGLQGIVSSEARRLLDLSVESQQVAPLGEVVARTDIKSSIGPFLVLPEYRIQYPEVVTHALGNLYAEYNVAFRDLVAANREWATDYQFCMARDGTPINGWVQIDMVGLPEKFLDSAPSLSEKDVREALRGRIFEIENSLAMYQLLENLFSNGQQDTLFKRQFRASLDDVREKHGRPIALLAVTDQKYQAMRESEFGKMGAEPLTDEEVRQLSGFNKFFAPGEFQQYLAENGGQCDYLLYARTSDPVAKLKKPDTKVEIPLLENDRTRRIIKANTVTFNVDNPEWAPGNPRRINDTKAYLPKMGMAYVVCSETDILTPEVVRHLARGKSLADYDGNIHSSEFARYLLSQGIDPITVSSGGANVRAKPEQGTYGCYGHVSGTLNEREVRGEIRKGLRDRGAYVIQPEMRTPIITNVIDGRTYSYIDRNFFSTDGQEYRFMGGFRSLMPVDSHEAKQRRIHGNGSTVWAEIS